MNFHQQPNREHKRNSIDKKIALQKSEIANSVVGKWFFDRLSNMKVLTENGHGWKMLLFFFNFFIKRSIIRFVQLPFRKAQTS